MLDLAKRLEYLEELAIHAGISWVGSVPGTMIGRSFLPERGVGWTVSFGPLQFPKLHYQAPTLDEALTLAENDLKARAQKKKREIRIRVREEEDAYSSSYEHDPDITWTATIQIGGKTVAEEWSMSSREDAIKASVTRFRELRKPVRALRALVRDLDMVETLEGRCVLCMDAADECHGEHKPGCSVPRALAVLEEP